MSQPPRPARRPPPRRAAFEPRFTLGLIYVVAFFFLFCLLLVAPAVYEVYETMPPGPEQQAEGARVAQEIVSPRLWAALLAAAAATGLGIYTRVLPGFRRRR